MIAFPLQTMELTSCTKHIAKVQRINAHVPEFQAWKCHGSGRRTSTQAKADRTGKRGYVTSDDLKAIMAV